jgi:pimeloyl-ACP methyl ester carboxylesterase
VNWTRPDVRDRFDVRADADQLAIERAMTTVSLGADGAVRVLSVGDGIPIVCMPMVAELNFVYAPQLAAFSDEYRVVAYEPNLSREARVDTVDRAAELCRLLDALQIPAAHVVAWSDVGAPAYQFAKRWPERCRSLSLLGLADRYVFPAPVQLGAVALNRWPLERILPSIAMAAFLGQYLRGDHVKRRWVVRRARKVPQLSRLFKHSVLPNLLDHMPHAEEVNVPSLVLGGDRDVLVTKDQARRMAELLGSSTFECIPGGEHFLGYVNEREVNQALKRFFARVDAVDAAASG